MTVTADDQQLGMMRGVHEHMTGPSSNLQSDHAGALVGTERLLDSNLKLTEGIGLVVP